MIYRILEVNTEDDTYKVVYDKGGAAKTATALMEAIVAYAKEVHVKDKPRFLNFFYDHKNKIPETVDHVYYRRMVDGKWKFACIEYIKVCEPIGLLIVKDIEDAVADFFEQLKD